ncbi:hypothetical protein K466DRAFT_605107 [Polyporus arcularius HHB13444]|uniref:DUF6533 domain-containing protein n=1 Tax=Polyporus arcularius HHB13444 TaxID=1314778 RepID=A0A5C3NTP3_9APHY|nr:hypothetical protein K466DRAFT_605107 [Polyporus arcularius HHB13444]
MSSDADAAAATVALFNDIENYCNTAAGVLFIYDTLVTLDREAACFWTAKRTGGASRLLFFANKWINLVYYVSGSLVPSIRFPSDKPSPPSVLPVGANLVPYGYQLSGENFPPFGCLRTDNIPAALIPKSGSFNLITYIDTDCLQGNCAVVIISRVPLIAADVLLIYITWTKLRGWAALTNTRQSKRLSLSEVLFSGGTIYFVILFVLNVLHLVLSVMAVTSDHGDDGQSLVTQFTAPLTAILISRFLLELQEANKMVVELDLDDPSRNPPHSMPSFISSLGGFVNPSLSMAWSENDESHELQVRSRSEGGETEDGVPTESPQAAASSSSTASRLSVDILNVP